MMRTLFELRRGVRLIRTESVEQTYLSCDDKVVPLHSITGSRDVCEAVLRLLIRPCTEDEITCLLTPKFGLSDVLTCVTRLRELQWLVVRLVRESEDRENPTRADVAVLVPCWPRLADYTAAVPRRLSRFAVLTPGQDCLIVDSPLSRGSLTIFDLSLVQYILGGFHTSESPEIHALACLVVEAGLLETDYELNDPAVASWSAPELTFHFSTRLRDASVLGGNIGATNWARDRFKLSSQTPVSNERPIQLAPLAEPIRTSLSDVLRARKSIREYDQDQPLELGVLSRFLLHAISVPEDSRPAYPSGGALYELEFYLACQRVCGLEKGMYKYSPREHSLVKLPTSKSVFESLLKAETGGLRGGDDPQCLVLIASRFQKLGLKYQGIGYSLTLKHVGAVIQNLYLVATALELAPCAIGTGASELFSRAVGLPATLEVLVGEFSIGSRKVLGTE